MQSLFQRLNCSDVAFTRMRVALLMLVCMQVIMLVGNAGLPAVSADGRPRETIEHSTLHQSDRPAAVLPQQAFSPGSPVSFWLSGLTLITLLPLLPGVVGPLRPGGVGAMLPSTPGLRRRPHLHAYRR